MATPRLTLLAGLALTAIAFAAPPAKLSPAQRGRLTFVRVGCAECHGTEGQGSSAGLRLAPAPLPLPALVQFVRNAQAPMPPYSEAILPDADLADIHAWLESVRTPPPPDRIPALAGLRDSD